MDNVYSIINKSFSATRYKVWKCVLKYISTIPENSILVEIGCGNGKNLRVRKDLYYIGCDLCKEFLENMKNVNKTELIYLDGLNLSFRDNSFSYIMSIAVIHHIKNIDDRFRFIKELIRIMDYDGLCLLTTWAFEQEFPKSTINKWTNIGNNSYLVPWKGGPLRFYYLYDEKEFRNLIYSFKEIEVLNLYFEKSNWIVKFRKIKIT